MTAFAMLAPSFASANDADVQKQLQGMQQRMQQMEDKLQATNDQLDSANQRVEEQSQLIEGAGLAETRGATNGLPGFLGQIKVSGSVASSYFYNVNDPNDHPNGLGGTNSGQTGAFYPLHPDHNSFAFDAAWFDVEREVSEENRGGFRFDTVYGKTGALLNGGGPNNRGSHDDTAFYIHQAYVQYLAPVMSGVTFKFGKFEDLFGVGTESANNAYSWNITRGNVWTLLEPIDHTGISATAPFGDSGISLTLAGVNGYLPNDPDVNDAKSVTGRLAYDNDKLHASVAGIWGSESRTDTNNANPYCGPRANFGCGYDGGQTGGVNATVRYDATDRLSMYLNGDYDWHDSASAAAWGIAAAGRFGITDRTGIALRGEYVQDVSQGLWRTGSGAPLFFGTNVWGITGTVDHLLTDNLMVRGEVRYDNIGFDHASNDYFYQDSNKMTNDQITVGAEAIYNFDKFGGGQ